MGYRTEGLLGGCDTLSRLVDLRIAKGGGMG